MFEAVDARAVYHEFQPLPAIVIPYPKPDGSGQLIQFSRGPFCRVRYLKDPPVARQRSGKPKKPLRYMQPHASGVHVYFPPIIDWPAVFADPEIAIIITEGEAKACAACLAGFPTIALGGVDSWRIAGTDELHPELSVIPWSKRNGFICFDSDAATNPSVLAAEAKLVEALQLKMGAQCNICRLPPDGANKVGLDDYLKKFGPDELRKRLLESEALGTLDAKVMSLNKHVAWIKREGLIWDNRSKMFLRKDNFITGDEYGTLKHTIMTGPQRTTPKVVSVAKTWLNHAHAARYDEILFRPGEPVLTETDEGRPALNMWSGWTNNGTGDVTPFLELSRFLFQNIAHTKDNPAGPELPVKLLAYKMQNPEKKVQLALMLIGPQGSGKSMWAEIVRDAFAPHGTVIASSQLGSNFRNWLERSLLCTVNEVQKEDLLKCGETLKSLITDLSQSMNEKYRAVRDVNSYTFYIFTANKHEVASFDFDDRRFVVIEVPSPFKHGDLEAQRGFYYDRVSKWKDRGGARDVAGYLQRLDLQGWEPPIRAPESIEKAMAQQEGLTPVQKLAEQMKLCKGTTPILLWLQQSAEWARSVASSNNQKLQRYAQSIDAAIELFPVRPFYEPRELALLFPHLLETNMGGAKWVPDHNAPEGQISRALRDEGITFLRPKDSQKGFWWKNAWRQYLVIGDTDDWTAPLAQSDFERVMSQFPTFGDVKRQMGQRAA